MGTGSPQYKKVVFAGTFDHLHEGHKYLLRTAFNLGEKVGIGLTTDSMAQRKREKDKIQSYQKRHDQLEDFIKSEFEIKRCTIFPIDTVEGGADEMEDLEAMIVSDEMSVVKNAFEINEKRAHKGFRRFHIIVVPRIRSADGRPLSSSRIRSGEKFDHTNLRY